MRKAGINLVEVKEKNRALILQLICTSKQITRSELSECSNLSSMTVTNIVNEFLLSGIVEETTPRSSIKTIGRTPKILQLSPSSPVILGFSFSKNKLEGIISDLSLTILTRETIAFEAHETTDSILLKMRNLTDLLCQQTDRRILGLGISAVGVIAPDSGQIQYITDFYDIKQLDIQPYLSKYYSFPIYVLNDMQAACLSELYFGHGKTEDNFWYVGITQGLGSAVVVNHEVCDFCGEMGHISIDCNGPLCSCGNSGCLELYASTPCIIREIENTCGIKVSDMERAVALSETNKTVYAVLYRALQVFTYGLNNHLNLISVPTVILGHDAFYLSDNLIDAMQKKINSINISVQAKQPSKLLKSSFGADAALFGSICIILKHLFQADPVLSLLQ